MATITAATTGAFGTGATWTGGSVPGPADRAVIPNGIDVTISDARVVQSFEIPDGDGRLLIAGSGSLEFSADSHVYGSTDNTKAYRVVIAAGGTLLWNPAAAATTTLKMGGAIHTYAGIEANGTAGAKCYIGKKAGSTGTALVRMYDGQTWIAGLTKSVHTRWVGLGTATVSGIVFTNRLHGRIDFEDCTIEGCGEFKLDFFNIADGAWSGACRFVRTTWTGSLPDPADVATGTLLAITGASTNGWIDFLECDIDGRANFTWSPGETPGNLTITGNIFRSWLNGTSWPQAKVIADGNFFCSVDGVDNSLAGTHRNFYQLIRGVKGNPHFWDCYENDIADAVFEYHGPYNVDTGDVFMTHGGTSILRRCLILPTPVAGKTSGSFSYFGGGAHLTIEHCTMYAGDLYTVLFPHSQAMAASRLVGRSNLMWSDTASPAGVAFHNDSPGNSDVDALAPADATHNAFVGLKDGTNLVGGVSTPLNGFDGCEFSVAPAGNLTLAAGGAQFVDPGRNFKGWCRTVRGHTGTDDQVIDLGIADIVADKALTASSLLPWVRAGFAPTAAALVDAGHDGVTIGAVGAGEGGEVEPPAGAPARYTEWLSKVWDIHHTLGTLPYLALARNAPGEPGYDPGQPENEGYNNNQGEHYDVVANMIHRREYLAEVGHAVTDWAYEVDAALHNFRENCIRYDAKLTQLQGHHCHSRGLAMHHHETGQEFDRTAIDAMILWNIGYSAEQYRNLNFLERARESAFYLNTSLDRRWVGLVPLDCEGPACDLMLELCEHWSRPRSERPFNGYFVWMSGLCMRSMIRYWEHHRTEPDPAIAARVAAIPAAVEAQLDAIVAVGWYPPGEPAIAEGGSTWDKGSVKYLYPDRTDPTYVPITDLVVQTVQSQYVFTGAAALSTVDDYYKGASIRPHGWTIPGGAQLWVSSYEGATRTFTAVAVFCEFTFTPGLVFDLEPVGWNDDIEQRGVAWASPVLNPIVSPAAAFAWWYRKVKLGDPAGAARHREFHHELFDGAYLAWGGAGQMKIHMEGFLWIREGLKWIDLGDAGTDYTLLRTYVLPDPVPITPTPATAFTVDGPASGAAGVEAPFTITLGAGAVAGSVRIRGRQDGGGTFLPPFLDLTAAVRAGTIAYLPDAAGPRLVDFVADRDVAVAAPIYGDGPEYSNPSFHHFAATATAPVEIDDVTAQQIIDAITAKLPDSLHDGHIKAHVMDFDDAIPMTLAASPSTFREWFVWLTCRFRRTARDKTTGTISVYGTNGSTVVTTQASSDSSTSQSTGVPS